MWLRTRTPQQTWELIEPLFESLGITRVGDITGLDSIGIPVWIAVRPNSRTLSVAQGKGSDHEAARVSAAMESLETAIAERPPLALELATYEQIASHEQAVDPAELPRPRVSLYGAKRPLFWTAACDVRTGATWRVPYEMVHADATYPWLPGSGSFLTSTNGLASGNCRSEALLHGLCEVVERDAVALWDHRSRAKRDASRVDLATVQDPGVRALLERFARARIEPAVWDATSDLGIAAFRAIIVDLASDEVMHPFPAAFGAGCHPDAAIALTRALTEAAQSRLTVIAGSRDDFGRTRYAQTQSADAVAYHRGLARASGAARSFGDVPHVAVTGTEDALDHVVRRLAGAGFDRILHTALTPPGYPVAVERVIVPGLEGPSEAPNYYPGRRVRALLAAER